MKMSVRAIVFAAVVLIASVPGAGAAPPTSEAARILKVMVDSTASGDVDAIAALYAPKGLLLSPDGKSAQGRDAIRAVFAANQAAGKNSLSFDAVRVEGDDSQAAVVWSWTLTIVPQDKPAVRINGRSLLYLQHMADGWQIVADLFQLLPTR